MAYVAPWWVLYGFDHGFRRLFHKTGKLFGPYVTSGMTVLDVGCGQGFFTVDLARMVGSRGRVIAVDIQQKNLDIVRRRADRAGVAGRVETVQCEADNIGVGELVDFVLAFWLVHETPDVAAFMKQVRACMKSDSHFLVTEPIFHVKRREFEESVRLAKATALTLCGQPRIWFCRTALFRPAQTDAVDAESDGPGKPQIVSDGQVSVPAGGEAR